MFSYSGKKHLYLFALFVASLISFTLLPRVLRAQTCTPACVDDGNPCNGPEFCGLCGNDVSTPCCKSGPPPADNTVSCSDGTFCNGLEMCVGGTCGPSPGNPCTPGECTDACSVDPNATSCNLPPSTSCTDTDNNNCTSSFCNGSGSCISQPNDFQCDDGVNCTLGDVCSGGVCSGTPVQCKDDGISCTLESCNESSGQCVSDNSKCECQTDADCDDSNPCTDEFCDANFTCVRSNNTSACDDGLFCNGPDTCSGGTCSVHSGDPCNAGSGICDTTCNESADDCFTNVGTACEGNDILTTNQCDGHGKCITVATSNSQGATLGCSLHPGEDDRFEISSLFCALAVMSSVLGLRKWEKAKNRKIS